MTIKHIKNAFERLHHKNPMEHIYHGNPNGYSYHAPPPPPIYHAPPRGHMYKQYSHSHSSGGGGHKSGAAMSALTLLSFLFFLNILQQCLKDHMMAMNPQVTMMAAAKEEPQPKSFDHTKVEQTPISHNNERKITTAVGYAFPSEINDNVKKGYGHSLKSQIGNNQTFVNPFD